jgi:GH15 family glucan-1,4-alpha-glucosidase
VALIEDYALIGDMQTGALVCRDGSVNWFCLPRFDSPAIFASMLGTEDHGFWRLGPSYGRQGAPPQADRRRYCRNSLVLESEWDTPRGTVRVVDFMPPRQNHPPQLIRIVEGVKGHVPVRSALRMRFSYGRIVPWVHKENGRTVAVAGPDSIWLDTDVPNYGKDLTTYADFIVSPGDRVAFAVSWQPSHWGPPAVPDVEAALAETKRFWEEWTGHCTYQGPYREAVIRSLIVLKALTHAPTGGIVASLTTSLPEEIGGVRNWDYRFTWLRDAAITLFSLLGTGYLEEARAWRRWLLRAVAGDPENLQIMYGIAGERELGEVELDWLPGYENSSPVRVGNGAARQLQLDVYGEVAETLHLAWQAGLGRDVGAARLQIRLIRYLEKHWIEPDEGIWEVRGPRRHFVHSKVMTWVAVDRTVKVMEAGEADGPLERWRKLRDRIHQDVCERGYDSRRNTFTQYYGSQELDASLLLIVRVGFLPPSDPRLVGTIEAIQRNLSTPDGFILRYPTAGEQAGIDGLEGNEGAFLACSFWLADALVMIGRSEEARELFERLLALRNDLGLLAEEWDPHHHRQVGNFPQAFSHVPLIDTALRLDPSFGT